MLANAAGLLIVSGFNRITSEFNPVRFPGYLEASSFFPEFELHQCIGPQRVQPIAWTPPARAQAMKGKTRAHRVPCKSCVPSS